MPTTAEIIASIGSSMPSPAAQEKYYRSELEMLRKQVLDFEATENKEAMRGLIAAAKTQREYASEVIKFKTNLEKIASADRATMQRAVTEMQNSKRDNLTRATAVWAGANQTYEQEALRAAGIADLTSLSTAGSDQISKFDEAYLGSLDSKAMLQPTDSFVRLAVEQLRANDPNIDKRLKDSTLWKKAVKAYDEFGRLDMSINDTLAKSSDMLIGGNDKGAKAQLMGLKDLVPYLGSADPNKVLVEANAKNAAIIAKSVLDESPIYTGLVDAMHALEGQRTLSLRQKVGTMVAKPEFRQWAEKNGYRLGTATVDKNGNLVKYADSNQDLRAVMAFGKQIRRGKGVDKPVGSGQLVKGFEEVADEGGEPAETLQVSGSEGKEVYYDRVKNETYNADFELINNDYLPADIKWKNLVLMVDGKPTPVESIDAVKGATTGDEFDTLDTETWTAQGPKQTKKVPWWGKRLPTTARLSTEQPDMAIINTEGAEPGVEKIDKFMEGEEKRRENAYDVDAPEGRAAVESLPVPKEVSPNEMKDPDEIEIKGEVSQATPKEKKRAMIASLFKKRTEVV
jgi:hypothetical protein